MTDEKRVNIYGRSDSQYAECCGYILMFTSALCIHVGMSTCVARPFLHQSVTSLFVCLVALRPKSTAMVIAGRSVHLTTLFPGQA